jgi:putative membrane protein insertion efficiency factor
VNGLREKLLVAGLLVGLLLFCDTVRSPGNQLTSRGYIGFVHLYQEYGRPALAGLVVCRYNPTCSEYSIRAVEKYGIWIGLFMTVKRLASCTKDVPLGTVDEVP